MSKYEKFTALVELAHDRNMLTDHDVETILTNVRPSNNAVEILLDFVSGIINIEGDTLVSCLVRCQG